MSKGYSARFIFFDFIETVLIILLVAFLLFYFILGDRMSFAGQIVKMLVPFSFFGVLFIFKLKISRRLLRKVKGSGSSGDVVIYFTNKDKFKDLGVIIIIFLLLLMIPWFIDKTLYIEDNIQIASIVVVLYLWHRYLFRNRVGDGIEMYLNKIGLVFDGIVNYLLPLIIVLISISFLNLDVIDIIQSLITFFIFFIWHKVLFNSAANN